MIIKQIKRYYLKKVQKQVELNLILEQSINACNTSHDNHGKAEKDLVKSKEELYVRIEEFGEIIDSDGLERFFEDNGHRWSSDSEELKKKILRKSPLFKQVLGKIESVRDDKNRYRERYSQEQEKTSQLQEKLDLVKADLELAIKSMKQENVELRLLLRKASHLENADNLVQETKLQLSSLDDDIRQIEQ